MSHLAVKDVKKDEKEIELQNSDPRVDYQVFLIYETRHDFLNASFVILGFEVYCQLITLILLQKSVIFHSVWRGL